MRSRLTLGVRCLPIIPCTAGRIRTRGTPLARKLPAALKRRVTWRDHARAWEPTKHPFGATNFTPDLSAESLALSRAAPLQTARGISIIAMQLSSAAHTAVLDFHADNSFIKYIGGQK